MSEMRGRISLACLVNITQQFHESEAASPLERVSMELDKFATQVFASLNVRKKTLATYQSMYKCHISAHLGHIKIEEVSRTLIKEAIYGLPP